ARPAVVAALWQIADAPMVVITGDDRTSDDHAHDLGMLVGADHVRTIHSSIRHKALSDAGSLRHDEVDALMRLHADDRTLIVISSSALLVKLPAREDLDSVQRSVRRGEDLPFEEFVTSLAINGYERTDYVGKPGEMAVRGGILDIYPGGWDNPLRIEFWGNTVDSIREFEPLSQRSIREHEEVEFLARVFHDDDASLTTTITDHLPTNTIVVLDGPEGVASDLHKLNADFSLDDLAQWTRILINPIGTVDVDVVTAAQPTFGGSVEQLLKTSASMQARNIEVHVGADGQHNAKRIQELCENVAEQLEEDQPDRAVAYHRAADSIVWHAKALSDGFVWEDLCLAIFSEHQVFGRQRAQRRTRRSESGFTMRELHQLQRGDYVVHEDKGVGQFDGRKTIEINGNQVDCVRLLFAAGDVLYVHLNYVHKLSKFAAEEGAVPKLSKLGSAEWERKKSRAKKRIKDIARDLIKLYAQRKSQPGFAFPIDSVWQKEFEASFQYEDTPDQARATAEVKIDMEQPSPMDRLVCGDVGFGKTEVAIRAAFKAAQTGKQVAVLVPTTILAQQHFVTFKDRLHRYPVTIEVLSRFRSKAEQKDVLERLEQGKVDIVIGTHRLLSKDVKFKNLGLLIIDEEHRFGVGAKEKLRQLRVTIDTLTLTATPIPRTLNFSLMGARDLSVIETPPRNRLPIKTEIMEWDDETLREAMDRELSRGGQVFVVTDKIHDMDKLQMRIKMLAPTLKVGMAHGQMPTEELEDVMEAFLERKTDVLIATKIIESGLDIPNANTMIINNADNFGLAELYQLRGRVGRSNIQAYCYLVIPPVHTLSRIALRRLQALEEFTDLGSGFQLAMRDLEIRGAGNLLGGEQSGFIMDMGFELYQKILDEAVAELRDEEFAELFADKRPHRQSFVNEDVAIELDADALLPASWIPTDTDRYDAYKRLYNAHDEHEIDAVFAELRDRFGALPAEAEHLWYAVRMRIAALPTGFIRVSLRESTLVVELPPDTDRTYYEKAFPLMLPLITSMPNARFVQHGKRLIVEIQLARRDDAIGIIREFSSAVTTSEVEV
ncbi:MAG: transcription-repair coupling factor, partial [Ignavibacteriae bacterium]